MEKAVSTWRRELWWCAEAEAALGDLIAGNRAHVVQGVAAGTVHLYRVTGAGADGWGALEFLERHADGAVECHIIAGAGIGSARAMDDLAAMCRKVGVAAIRCETDTQGLCRLYRRLKFREAWRVFVMELDQ